jgi:hypothetical protein
MSFREALALEMRVAFSRNAQPVWFRVLKWIVLVAVGWSLWGGPYFWWCASAALVLALTLHLLWRSKTKVWTQPWGGWSDLDGARGDRSREAR